MTGVKDEPPVRSDEEWRQGPNERGEWLIVRREDDGYCGYIAWRDGGKGNLLWSYGRCDDACQAWATSLKRQLTSAEEKAKRWERYGRAWVEFMAVDGRLPTAPREAELVAAAEALRRYGVKL